MKTTFFASLPLLMVVQSSAFGQPIQQTINSSLCISKASTAKPGGVMDPDNVVPLAVRAIEALKRLEGRVVIYRSLADFEEHGKLAHVPFDTFAAEVRCVLAEVEPLLSRLPRGRLKSEITNTLYSYRDGMFWWGEFYRPRVVHASALSFAKDKYELSKAAYAATIPYTVAIHWRHASKYLKRAEALIDACEYGP